MLRYFDHGVLYLGTDGCGEDWRLVVTGEQRGQLWNCSEVVVGKDETGRVMVSPSVGV